MSTSTKKALRFTLSALRYVSHFIILDGSMSQKQN